MLFNSFDFALFFPIVLLLYWVSPFRVQNALLLVASYVFYGFWDWRFLSLILISTVVDYIAGMMIHEARLKSGGQPSPLAKRWLILSICTNLGILGFFKYFNFFAGSLTDLLGTFGFAPDLFYLNIILPVGISFYTFQTMSYTIDIYRGDFQPTRKFLEFAVYVAFFPQLVAGPIERARALLPRILKPRTFNPSQFYEGLHLILTGFFKKVFVADNLAPFVDRIFASPDPTGFEVLVGGYGFAFQLYCDFSGYSDIARGCAKCLGIDLMLNFNHPYVACNPSDRWQRWHISLSSWLRDYLYIGLGGNRGGNRRTYRNLYLTMLLGGLWHGAAWNFVFWGAWEGSMLVAHRLTRPFLDRQKWAKAFPAFIKRFVKMFAMFHLVLIGWIVFRTSSFSHAWVMLTNMFTFEGAVDSSLLMPLAKFVLPLILVEVTQHWLTKDKWENIERIPSWARAVFYALMFYLVAFYGAAAESFIYFQF